MVRDLGFRVLYGLSCLVEGFVWRFTSSRLWGSRVWAASL